MIALLQHQVEELSVLFILHLPLPLFYKSKIRSDFEYLGLNKNDQINYFELECLRSALMIDLGLGFKMSNEISSFALIAQKEIF